MNACLSWSCDWKLIYLCFFSCNLLILAPLLYFLRKKVNESKREYEIDEIQSASYALTVALMLLIRDGKDEGIDPDGTLVKLTREMQQLAQFDRISSPSSLSSSASSSSLPHIEMICIKNKKIMSNLLLMIIIIMWMCMIISE